MLKKDCHTIREIEHQPRMWEETFQIIGRRRNEIMGFFSRNGFDKTARIVFTGAGTSAFVADSAAAVYMKDGFSGARSVATTDIVSAPESFISPEDRFFVSFARSGNSPESVAAYKIVRKLCHEAIHIIITCNQTLFGLETGSSLNDKFEIMRDILPFYFTYDKQMIVKDEPWGAIDDYLARRPMAPATLYLRLTEIPPEAPCEVAFSVEVKVADKEPFHATAQPITLLR